MNLEDTTELYILKCASMKLAVDHAMAGMSKAAASVPKVEREASLSPFVAQFPAETRHDAEAMAEYYKLFYMLENDMRKLIDDTLSEKYGTDWWDEHAPVSTKDECKSNQQREREAGVTARSDNPLDYISFGQLGDIMRAHWDLFGGILSNQKALGRVMFALNMLRGPIAHCGILAEDEVDRLKLTVKDWFRLLEGPQ
jgi:hypothetical protein